MPLKYPVTWTQASEPRKRPSLPSVSKVLRSEEWMGDFGVEQQIEGLRRRASRVRRGCALKAQVAQPRMVVRPSS